jgi:Mannosyltransferase putative
MTCHLNSKKVRDEITYVKFYGDKESYWYAHTLTSTPYHYVPGYAGGLGQITPQTANADKQHICTSRLLHVLESTKEPFWFNSGLSVFKWNNDDKYLVPDGWVGHDGEWYKDTAATLLNQYCVQVPERPMQVQEPINRVEGEIKELLEEMIQLAKTYDDLMVQAGLIKIA